MYVLYDRKHMVLLFIIPIRYLPTVMNIYAKYGRRWGRGRTRGGEEEEEEVNKGQGEEVFRTCKYYFLRERNGA